MIKFLTETRYNFVDMVCQATMVWGLTKYDDWKWMLVIFPFALLNAFLQSIERVNNGNKK